MRAIIDPHTHTIASGHYTTDTVTDLARVASEKKLNILGITDHSPVKHSGASESYFRNLKYCEKKRFGVQILYGVEVDVLNSSGQLALPLDILNSLDLVIVSQHTNAFKPSTERENTAAFISAIKSGRIDIVGHPDDVKYPLCIEELCKVCADYGTMMEINNASLSPDGYRGNSRPIDISILELCEKYNVFVSMGSDSHGAKGVGDFSYAESLIKEFNFPEKLVVNYSEQLFNTLLKQKR